jgi:hypothetical protein
VACMHSVCAIASKSERDWRPAIRFSERRLEHFAAAHLLTHFMPKFSKSGAYTMFGARCCRATVNTESCTNPQ